MIDLLLKLDARPKKQCVMILVTEPTVLLLMACYFSRVFFIYISVKYEHRAERTACCRSPKNPMFIGQVMCKLQERVQCGIVQFHLCV